MAGEYKAVYVNISEVQVHKAGSTTDKGGKEGDGAWLPVGSPNKIYNLLELVNGVMESLGTRELEAGKYTQVRLILGEDISLDQELNCNRIYFLSSRHGGSFCSSTIQVHHAD